MFATPEDGVEGRDVRRRKEEKEALRGGREGGLHEER